MLGPARRAELLALVARVKALSPSFTPPDRVRFIQTEAEAALDPRMSED